jgi:hypothetical protein
MPSNPNIQWDSPSGPGKIEWDSPAPRAAAPNIQWDAEPAPSHPIRDALIGAANDAFPAARAAYNVVRGAVRAIPEMGAGIEKAASFAQPAIAQAGMMDTGSGIPGSYNPPAPPEQIQAAMETGKALNDPNYRKMNLAQTPANATAPVDKVLPPSEGERRGEIIPQIEKGIGGIAALPALGPLAIPAMTGSSIGEDAQKRFEQGASPDAALASGVVTGGAKSALFAVGPGGRALRGATGAGSMLTRAAENTGVALGMQGVDIAADAVHGQNIEWDQEAKKAAIGVPTQVAGGELLHRVGGEPVKAEAPKIEWDSAQSSTPTAPDTSPAPPPPSVESSPSQQPGLQDRNIPSAAVVSEPPAPSSETSPSATSGGNIQQGPKAAIGESLAAKLPGDLEPVVQPTNGKSGTSASRDADVSGKVRTEGNAPDAVALRDTGGVLLQAGEVGATPNAQTNENAPAASGRKPAPVGDAEQLVRDSEGRAGTGQTDGFAAPESNAAAPLPATSVDTGEGGKVEQAKTQEGAKPRKFFKADLERALLDRHEREAGNEQNALQSEIEDQGIGAFTFHQKLPEEVTTFLEGRPELKKVFRVTQNRSEAGGEDAMANLGDRYFDIAGQRGGKDIENALQHAEKSQDPEAQMQAAIYRNLPPTKDRVPYKMQDAANVPTGTKFKIQGHEFQVVEDADGFRVLKDGDDYPALPADQVGKIPIDKQSIEPPKRTTPPKTGKLDQLEQWATQRLAEKDAAEQEALSKPSALNKRRKGSAGPLDPERIILKTVQLAARMAKGGVDRALWVKEQIRELR